ncbi:MAG: hypothetical protein Q9O24_13295 [Gammaproteobacteria bacterium]|nr:hypothetical protein [Gammaproteobacteria bacterium]
MSRTVEELEAEVTQLPKDQLALFRAWFEAFDAHHWDKQVEADVAAGKLDALADAALAEHRTGKTKRL